MRRARQLEHRNRRLGALATVAAIPLFWLVACGSESESAVADAATRESEPTDAGTANAAERPALCARDRNDAVRDVFCAPNRPTIRSLEDLQVALGLRPHAPSNEQLDADAGYLGSGAPGLLPGDRPVAVLGHSTALSGHRVSPINPRLIIMGDVSLMAYQRGVQKAEVITPARSGLSLNFYLFSFEQACNRRREGCLPGDLYTPNVESDWLSVTIEDDEDLKNTPNDCRQCHQRALETPRVLMRELNSPWTHFLQPKYAMAMAGPPGVRASDLMRDYIAAKGDEPYGGMRLSKLAPIAPFALENLATTKQPVLFDAPGIENERWPYDQATKKYASDPKPSPTWEAAYAAFKRGEQLALPYFEVRVSDLDKQARHSEAYARYRAGELDADELPELSDVFPDDPLVRARIGLQTEPGADAVDAMIQACGSCHNDVLDQTVTRARFNIDLWKLDAAEIATAIERIEREATAPGVMPPPEARQLDRAGRKRLLAYLREDPLAREPDDRLRQAAIVGMAGGANRTAIERR